MNDDNDFATAFADDVMLFHIPARLAAAATEYFGVLPLSQCVHVKVTPGEPQSPLSDPLRKQFYDSLPYVWAWRSSQSNQVVERLSARLKSLKVYIVPELKANLSLDGMHHEVERHWHVTAETIFLHKEHEAALAQALAKALDVRSEADFYEILLRCSNSIQRKEKLLSKGMVDAEVERCLREYSGKVEGKEETEKSLEKSTGDSTSGPPSNGGSGPGSSKDRPQSPKPNTSPDIREKTGKTLRLKRAITVDYDVIGHPQEDVAGPSVGGAGHGGTGQEAKPLSDKEKAELEEAGRTIAVRELERRGFCVEKMPLENPGFDLRATRNGMELRVEVKAHLGRASVVDVTQRQYKEYIGQQAYIWELWNIEHLSEEDVQPVMLSRYDELPDDALDTRTFRVDLRKCHASANHAGT